MVKACCILLLISLVREAQPRHPLEKKVIKMSFLKTKTYDCVIPPFTILDLNFELKNIFEQDTTFYLRIESIPPVSLYENKGKQKTEIAKTGIRVPIPERSVKNDYSAIKIHLKGYETKKLTLTIANPENTRQLIMPFIMGEINYKMIALEKKESLTNKYLIPGFFVILLLVILLTVMQYFINPERVFVYYFGYIFFTIIRSSAGIEFIVLENWFPFLNQIGYNSLHSQVFTFLSLIFYALFLREFTNFPSKMPRLDLIFKFQIVFFAGFMVFDLFFPIEKYTNPQLHFIFRGLETFGLIIGIIAIFFLFKVYDFLNKYIIFGAISIYLIAVLGQEIVKRTYNIHDNPDFYRNALVSVWAIAYLVEIAFFTVALVMRQRLLLKTAAFEQKQNQLLTKQLDVQKLELLHEQNSEYDSFSISTKQGVLIFQQADIVRLEASGNYTILSIQNHKQTLASSTLSEFQLKLNPSKFIRVHKSHLVNIQHIIKYNKGDGGTLTLQDGSEIPVSRSRKEELLKKLYTT